MWSGSHDTGLSRRVGGPEFPPRRGRGGLEDLSSGLGVLPPSSLYGPSTHTHNVSTDTEKGIVKGRLPDPGFSYRGGQYSITRRVGVIPRTSYRETRVCTDLQTRSRTHVRRCTHTRTLAHTRSRTLTSLLINNRGRPEPGGRQDPDEREGPEGETKVSPGPRQEEREGTPTGFLFYFTFSRGRAGTVPSPTVLQTFDRE